MKDLNKAKTLLKAVLVIAVALAFILPTSAVVTNTTTPKHYTSKTCNVSQLAIHKPLTTTQSLGTDVLISSDNLNNTDEAPKVIMSSSEGTIIVTYEKVLSGVSRVIPIVYSKDFGQTWTEQFEIDSANMQEGSGYLQSPDIKYSYDAQQFFWQAIDPLATMYNEEIFWIPDDIENTTEIMGYGISGESSTDYTEGALTYVGKWIVALAIDDGFGFTKIPGLGYFWFDGTDVLQPADVDPAWAAGFYYDGQSVLHTAEANKPEMATGNRLYMVMESFNVTPSISFKATVTDLNPTSPTFLYTKGGGPGGMDEFADIEVWPLKQMHIATNATDPDVSAKGNTVAVVYTQNYSVKCSASANGGDAWTNTTVAAGAGYPAVYVTKDKIYCAYVKERNLSYVVSSDNGATWGIPTQVNDVAGTVVAQPGTVDIGAPGFVWTDNRSSNGYNDIYYEYMEIEPPIKLPKLLISAVTGGLGISVKVGNNGRAAATNVAWTAKVTGGILGFINVSGTGTISSLAIGGEDGGKTKMILGLGTIAIAVTATCDEGSTATLSKDGTQLLFFTSIK